MIAGALLAAVAFGPTPPAIAQTDRPAIETGWEQLWRLDVSRGGSAPLVWADSTLIVASLDRNLHVIQARPEPKVVWKENFKGGFEAPPVVSNERIYLGETLKGGRLVALDRRTRATIWTVDAGDLIAPPVVRDDRIYTISSVGVAKAYDTAGAELWSTELATRVVAAPAWLDGTLVVSGSDGHLFAIDPASGTIRDSLDSEAGMIWGQPLVGETTPATALYATLDGQVIEIDRDLTVLQRRSFPSSFYAGPVLDGERVILVGHEGTIWSYEWEPARIVWQRALSGTFRSPGAIGRGLVLVGDLAGTLTVLDRGTGEIRWQTHLDDAITAQPLVRDTVYVMTEKGTLYAFREVGPSP